LWFVVAKLDVNHSIYCLCCVNVEWKTDMVDTVEIDFEGDSIGVDRSVAMKYHGTTEICE
jgi:hypothetical protein